MITQKAISAKIDLHILQSLDEEVKTGWKSRNRIINDAIRMYCDARKLRRTMRDKGHDSESARLAAANFLKTYVTPEAHIYVDMIDL